MKFLKPIDGDVLFSVADGREDEKGLWTTITVEAPVGRTVRINGVEAREENGLYTAEILVDSYRNAVEASDGEETETMVIYWFRNGYKTYRMTIDDVIWALENIWRNQDTYTSIFDDPFFALFRDLHDQYGVPVHMHIYYENEDGSFNLSMFPEKYKPEFQANGHWLKLTFHARNDNIRFKNLSYRQVMEDGLLVEREIRRFAGASVMSNVTSQHMSDSGIEGARAFRNLGYRCLEGYFVFDSNGKPQVSYYLNEAQTAHAATRDFWMDNRENILFVKTDIVLDQTNLEDIVPHMEAVSREQNHCFHYVMIHEEYFYPHYVSYRPDYRERVFAAVDWCHRNGYRPALIGSFAFERNLMED